MLRGNTCKLSIAVAPVVVIADIPSKKEEERSSIPDIQYGIPAREAQSTQEKAAVAIPSRLEIVCVNLSNRP